MKCVADFIQSMLISGASAQYGKIKPNMMLDVLKSFVEFFLILVHFEMSLGCFFFIIQLIKPELFTSVMSLILAVVLSLPRSSDQRWCPECRVYVLNVDVFSAEVAWEC